MSSPDPPLDAETTDELLVGYVNGSSMAEQRLMIEESLAADPVMRARLEAWQAVRAGARSAPPGVDARPPTSAELAALWAVVDADTPSAPSSLPPPAPVSLDDVGRGRVSRRLLGAAAAIVLLVGGTVAVVVLARDGGGDDSDVIADHDPALESLDEMRVALRRSADATAAARTANVTFRALAEAELSAGPLVLEMAGTGQVELPGRSILETRTRATSPDGDELLPASYASVVEDGGRTFVRCGGEADYTEHDPDAAACTTLALGADVLGPDATIDMLEEAAVFDIEQIGEEVIGDVRATGYQVVEPIELDGGSAPLTLQIWIDDDSLIRRIVGATTYGDTEGGMTSLVISYELTDYGVAVDIPDLD